MKILGSEFARTRDIMQAYNAAAQISRQNESYLEFHRALWADIFVLSTQLSRLGLELWKGD